MKTHRAPVLALSTAAFALAVTVLPAQAGKFCGGDVECACGDTVSGVAVLTDDLGVCTGLGLGVSSGAVLDCAGHTVTGSNLPGAWYGIQLDGASGATVRNCKVTLFRRGIRIRGGGNNVIRNNNSFKNKYGIDVAEQTTGNLILRNVVTDNRDEGIHVGSGADGNTINGNQILRSKNENLYFLDANNCTVARNTIAGSGQASIYVKESDGNVFRSNSIADGSVHVRGDSSGNVFLSNRVTGYGFFFQAIQDPTTLVWTFPHDNRVAGGWIHKADFCFRFFGAYDNSATAVRTDGACVPVDSGSLGGQDPTGNTVSFAK